MRVAATGAGLLFAALIVAAVSPVKPGWAAGTYCPNPDHAAPGKVPADLMGAVATTFQIDNDAVRKAAFVNCAGPNDGCYIGANLDATSRDEPFALSDGLVSRESWFKDHPMSATVTTRSTSVLRPASAGKAMVTVDPHGYIADNWRELR